MSGREVSAAYRAAYEAKVAADVDCLYLRVPKKEGEFADLEFWFCTDQPIVIGEQVYLNRITRFPQSIKHSLGRTPDGGDVGLWNADRELGAILGDPERDSANIYCLASRAYDVNYTNYALPIWEADPIFSGYASRVRIGDEITFQLISDTQRRGAAVGGEEVPQRCRFVFNVNGNHPLGGRCRWVPAQGGDPLFCDHTPAGCEAHNNRFRYGGVAENLKRAARVVVPPGGGDDDPFGNGWPPGVTPRPHPYFDPDFGGGRTRMPMIDLVN